MPKNGKKIAGAIAVSQRRVFATMESNRSGAQPQEG
jgi:hypothetical protein